MTHSNEIPFQNFGKLNQEEKRHARQGPIRQLIGKVCMRGERLETPHMTGFITDKLYDKRNDALIRNDNLMICEYRRPGDTILVKGHMPTSRKTTMIFSYEGYHIVVKKDPEEYGGGYLGYGISESLGRFSCQTDFVLTPRDSALQKRLTVSGAEAGLNFKGVARVETVSPETYEEFIYRRSEDIVENEEYWHDRALEVHNLLIAVAKKEVEQGSHRVLEEISSL